MVAANVAAIHPATVSDRSTLESDRKKRLLSCCEQYLACGRKRRSTNRFAGIVIWLMFMQSDINVCEDRQATT